MQILPHATTTQTHDVANDDNITIFRDPVAEKAQGLVRFLGPIMGGLSIACAAMVKQGMTMEQARFLFEFAYLCEGGKDDQGAPIQSR